MRKLMSKKGFTLVELMIVVVILGILVAVAVPIFGAVTKNARVKSCRSNQRVIKGNMETFMTTGASDGGPINLGVGSSSELKSEASFLKLFDGKTLPLCPSATDDEKTNGTYNTTVTVAADSVTYNSTCTTADGAAGKEAHNA